MQNIIIHKPHDTLNRKDVIFSYDYDSKMGISVGKASVTPKEPSIPPNTTKLFTLEIYNKGFRSCSDEVLVINFD